MILIEYLKGSLQGFLPSWIFQQSQMPEPTLINMLLLFFVIVIFIAVFIGLVILQIRYNIFSPFISIIRTIFTLGGNILAQFEPKSLKSESARFLTKQEVRKHFKPDIKRSLFAIDGANRRVCLSDKQLEGHTVLFSKTGGGKSSVIMVPNLLSMDNVSLVISDVSGDLLEKTGSELKSKGYEILVFSLLKPQTSLFVNPLSFLKNRLDVLEFSKNLVISGYGSSAVSDPFWFSSSASFLSFIISLLLKAPIEYQNLSNVYYLINNFNSKAFIRFLAKYGDDYLISNYKSIVSGNEKALASFKQICTNALSFLIVPELSYILSKNEIDFKSLRKKKTALFVQSPVSSHLSGVVNMFFNTFFKEIQSELPEEGDLPIYAMLDEFPAIKIADFASISFNIRKYKVSFIILCQSVDQLEMTYGKTQAHAILNGAFANLVFMRPNTNTAQYLERIIGRTFKNEYGATRPLLMSHDLAQMAPDELLLFCDGLKPALIKTLPAYKHPLMLKQMQQVYELQKRFEVPEAVKLYPLDSLLPKEEAV